MLVKTRPLLSFVALLCEARQHHRLTRTRDHFYVPRVQNIAATAIAIAAVHTQPNTFSRKLITN